jgi:hypothetical protein
MLTTLWLIAAALAVSVFVYRVAFPREEAEQPDEGEASRQAPQTSPPPPQGPSPSQPVLDTRPRMSCPRCGEMVPVGARLCRFCGHRFAGMPGPANPYPQ